MKYSHWIGILAAALLVLACFMPWAFYPDLQKSFTGFYSENNMYGRPGKLFVVLAVVSAVLYLVPKIWAKRWNLLVCGITMAYAIKSYIVYSSCYRGICPDKKAGLWLMLGASILMMVMALMPDLKIRNTKQG